MALVFRIYLYLSLFVLAAVRLGIFSTNGDFDGGSPLPAFTGLFPVLPPIPPPPLMPRGMSRRLGRRTAPWFYSRRRAASVLFLLLLLCGDVEVNPGPAPPMQVVGIVKCVCSSSKDVGSMVQCDTCNNWSHCKCVHITASHAPSYPFVCPHCVKSSVLDISCLKSHLSLLASNLVKLTSEFQSSLPSSFVSQLSSIQSDLASITSACPSNIASADLSTSNPSSSMSSASLPPASSLSPSPPVAVISQPLLSAPAQSSSAPLVSTTPVPIPCSVTPTEPVISSLPAQNTDSFLSKGRPSPKPPHFHHLPRRTSVHTRPPLLPLPVCNLPLFPTPVFPPQSHTFCPPLTNQHPLLPTPVHNPPLIPSPPLLPPRSHPIPPFINQHPHNPTLFLLPLLAHLLAQYQIPPIAYPTTC